MMIDVMPNAYPLAKGGRVRGLAVLDGAALSRARPSIPTIAESGRARLRGQPRGTASSRPPARRRPSIDRLNAAIRQALEDPQVARLAARPRRQAVPGTPDGLRAATSRPKPRNGRGVRPRSRGAKID